MHAVKVYEKVANQMQSMDIPVMAVSLTAIPRANTPVLLMVHWHGFDRQHDLKGIPSSALQLNEAWMAIEHLDDAMLQAAWQLGAWDLVREERRGCDTAGASDREMLECRQAFAQHPFEGADEDFMVSVAPDREDLMRLGARIGYVRWQFRPVKNGLWTDASDDDTLLSDGSRESPCPVMAKPAIGTRLCRTLYHLGHSSQIVLA